MLTKQDYQDALDSQNACNAAGLVNALARIMPKLAHLGTDARNAHPIVRLYIEQLAFLASGTSYLDAITACESFIEDHTLWAFVEEDQNSGYKIYVTEKKGRQVYRCDNLNFDTLAAAKNHCVAPYRSY